MLSERLAQRYGRGQIVSKQIISELEHSSSLATIFCPKAKRPNVKWGFQKGADSNTNINFAFRGGEVNMTNGTFNIAQDGRINYDFTLVNPETGVQSLSTKGFYDPTKALFSTKEHGAGYSWKDGELTIHAHSSGFSNDTVSSKENTLKIAKQIKDFFREILPDVQSSQRLLTVG